MNGQRKNIPKFNELNEAPRSKLRGIQAKANKKGLEAALQRRYPLRPDMEFVRLGKPHAAIFQKALERSGTRDMVMVGDQLETDVRGAAEFGIDSALVGTGIANVNLQNIDKATQPTYFLKNLSL